MHRRGHKLSVHNQRAWAVGAQPNATSTTADDIIDEPLVPTPARTNSAAATRFLASGGGEAVRGPRRFPFIETAPFEFVATPTKTPAPAPAAAAVQSAGQPADGSAQQRPGSQRAFIVNGTSVLAARIVKRKLDTAAPVSAPSPKVAVAAAAPALPVVRVLAEGPLRRAVVQVVDVSDEGTPQGAAETTAVDPTQPLARKRPRASDDTDIDSDDDEEEANLAAAAAAVSSVQHNSDSAHAIDDDDDERAAEDDVQIDMSARDIRASWAGLLSARHGAVPAVESIESQGSPTQSETNPQQQHQQLADPDDVPEEVERLRSVGGGGGGVGGAWVRAERPQFVNVGAGLAAAAAQVGEHDAAGEQWHTRLQGKDTQRTHASANAPGSRRKLVRGGLAERLEMLLSGRPQTHAMQQQQQPNQQQPTEEEGEGEEDESMIMGGLIAPAAGAAAAVELETVTVAVTAIHLSAGCLVMAARDCATGQPLLVVTQIAAIHAPGATLRIPAAAVRGGLLLAGTRSGDDDNVRMVAVCSSRELVPVHEPGAVAGNPTDGETDFGTAFYHQMPNQHAVQQQQQLQQQQQQQATPPKGFVVRCRPRAAASAVTSVTIAAPAAPAAAASVDVPCQPVVAVCKCFSLASKLMGRVDVRDVRVAGRPQLVATPACRRTREDTLATLDVRLQGFLSALLHCSAPRAPVRLGQPPAPYCQNIAVAVQDGCGCLATLLVPFGVLPRWKPLLMSAPSAADAAAAAAASQAVVGEHALLGMCVAGAVTTDSAHSVLTLYADAASRFT